MVEQVYDVLKAQIRQGQYASGEKLPAESELAQQFGVNRLTVRLALQKLNAIGIAETRIGDGTYARQASLRPLLDELLDFYDTPEMQADVKAMRNLLELECIRLAIEKDTVEEKEKLRQCLKDYNESSRAYFKDVDSEQLLDSVTDLDLAFHSQIIHMSHNRLYEDVYRMLKKLVRKNIRSLISRRSHHLVAKGIPLDEKLLDQHTTMCETVCNGNLEEAQKVCQQIIDVLPIPGVDDK